MFRILKRGWGTLGPLAVLDYNCRNPLPLVVLSESSEISSSFVIESDKWFWLCFSLCIVFGIISDELKAEDLEALEDDHSAKKTKLGGQEK